VVEERSHETRKEHNSRAGRNPKNDRQSHDGRSAALLSSNPLLSVCSTNSSNAPKRGGAGRGNWGKKTDDAEVVADVAADAEEAPVAEVPADIIDTLTALMCVLGGRRCCCRARGCR
jgi:hypothetical protein